MKANFPFRSKGVPMGKYWRVVKSMPGVFAKSSVSTPTTHRNLDQRCGTSFYDLGGSGQYVNASEYVLMVTNRRLLGHLEFGNVATYPDTLVHHGASSLVQQRACVSRSQSSTRGVRPPFGTAPSGTFRRRVSFRRQTSFGFVGRLGLVRGLHAYVGKALDSQHRRTHHHLFARTASERKHVRLDYEYNQPTETRWFGSFSVTTAAMAAIHLVIVRGVQLSDAGRPEEQRGSLASSQPRGEVNKTTTTNG